MAAIKTAIQPWLSVRNSAKAAEFYKRAFSAIETYRMEMPDGGLVLKLSVDDAEFWVSGHSNDVGQPDEENLVENSIKIVLVVSDPDALFKQAIKAGAKEIFAIGEGHGWRLGRLEDPFGLHWEVGKPLT